MTNLMYTMMMMMILLTCLLTQICCFIVSFNVICQPDTFPYVTSVQSSVMRQQSLHCPTAKYGRYTYMMYRIYERYGRLIFFKMADSRHPGFDLIGNSAVRSAVPQNLTLKQTWSRSDDALLSYGHLKSSKMCEWPWGRSSVVSRQYLYFLTQCHILLFGYVRNAARSVRGIKTNKCVR